MRWPWVSRSRLEATEQRLTKAERRADRATIGRRHARWQLDQVLAALAVFGAEPTAHPDAAEQFRRIDVAQKHLDEVLTAAVLWRETEQDGGMAGSGYIAQRGRTLATALFGRTDERKLP